MKATNRWYDSYLLRLWRDEGEGETSWRALLESPHTGERHAFTSLEDLFLFLDAVLAQVEDEERVKGSGS